MRFTFVAALTLALAACGQSGSGGSSESGGGASGAPTYTAAQNQSAIAALPAPYNSANYEAGRTVFAQCRSCHTIANGGANMVGPNLHGVIGRHIGTVQNFNYSPPVKASDISWDAEHLDRWVANPQAMIPGTRMGFAGVRDATQRRDLIAYMMVEAQR